MEYKNIQGLRAIAALLVVGCHFHDFADRYGFQSEALITIGAWGVDLFFVISGFIMIVVNWNKFSKPNAPKAFLIRRIVRIFPPYWLVTLVIVTAIIISPKLFHTWTVNTSNLLPSLLLLPSEQKPILYVGWTLIFEMYFYYVFATLLNFSRKTALTVMAV
jgi:exopolysaccharide production protein ExoZ